jgi:hypothetical protein
MGVGGCIYIYEMKRNAPRIVVAEPLGKKLLEI